MVCIFCDTETEAKSIEHIVSESFGNKNYVMERGKVCDVCNGRFSKFENTALTNSYYIAERARLGVATKKGHNAKGQIKGLTIEGNTDFRKDYIMVKGLTKDNFKNFNPSTKIGHLVIASFDDSEVATSKLVLKIGLESICKSQKHLLNKYDFSEIKNYLTSKNNIDWPFLKSDYEGKKFNSVPRFFDKYQLKQNHCELKFLELNENTLLFKFKYGVMPITLNLINRNMDWITETLKEDSKAYLFPEHYRKKLERQKKALTDNIRFMK